ncbi:MAG: DUF305 domain-containing protein, partial [Rhizobiaceae bacterium]
MLQAYNRKSPFQKTAAIGLAVATLLAATTAEAHVKWFAPYIVGSPPQPLATVLQNIWFWMGLALVVVFFVLARALETSRFGGPIYDMLDRATGPLWLRIDDYIRVVVGAFFVAIFAVGGVYLTPDLRT